MKTKTYWLSGWLLCTGLISCSAQEPAPAKTKTYTVDNLKVTEQLRQLFTQEAKYQHLSGSVIIRNQDSIIYDGTFGRTNRGITNGSMNNKRFRFG
ncbi:MAG: hypothetical protein RIM99_12230 [Cyclobacteriaceae bacterium]